MNVFISYSHRDSEIALSLSRHLENKKFDVFIDNKIPFGGDIYREIGKGIAKADAVAIIISKNYKGSFGVVNEAVFLTNPLLSFMNRGKMPLIIPIIIGDDFEIPLYIKDLNCLKISSLDKLDEAFEQVAAILKMHEQKILDEQVKEKQAEEKVKKSLSVYIEDVFATLKYSEKRNRRLSVLLYCLSSASILISIIIFYLMKDVHIDSNNYIHLGFLLISNVIITTLIIATSRLFFILGKAFMVESIRNADRIHAISFGKFFLDAYGNDATRAEIIQAFNSWNIDGGSSFRTQSTEEFDPKLSEFLKLLKKE